MKESESSSSNAGPDPSLGNHLAILAARLLPTLSLAFDSDAAPEQERSRYVVALYGLAHFLRGWNGSDLYSDKLMELASALDDLDDGIQPPLLTPARKGAGRRPDPSAKMRGRAFVALALDALLRGGKEKAASHIQNHYKPLKSLCDKKSSSIGDAAKEWRDSFSAGDIRDREAVAIFQSVRPTFKQLNPAECLQQATIFLNEALKVAANFR
jgi:hypothetical protein